MLQRPRLFLPAEFEPTLAAGERKAQGVYYTPPEIAERIVDWTLRPLLEERRATETELRILDPSCGAGEFLVAAFRRLSAMVGSDAARSALWGVDTDDSAVGIARARLKSIDPAFPVDQVITTDTLTTTAFPSASFDAVIGNPPYINIRQLAKALSREQIQALRRSYATATGNFDLYVLFIERAIELLKPGGRCGLIVPGKWATLDYARACRELLLSKTTIEQVVDLSELRAFADANVYPHIVVFQKSVARSAHAIQYSDGCDSQPSTILQSSLTASAFQFSALLDIESRISSTPLGEIATIACGTAGYAAQKIASRIVDQTNHESETAADACDFITSGNIDRYEVRIGNVRYLNRTYVRPKLSLAAPELTAAKRRMFGSPKIVVAGMSRRLEAAWDDKGLALGVQVFALSECRLDPFYILALLNSKLLSYLFATRFAAKRLGGGYLAINKGQLTQLPIRVVTAEDHEFSRKAEQLGQLAGEWSPANEPLIDQLVYQIYQLTEAEIGRVEAHFADLAARAA